MSNKFIAFILSLTFFVVALITLPHYGINWDTINHLPRGQAYLHYFLTGKTDYSDLAPWTRYWQDPNALGIKSDIPKEIAVRRSFYQIEGITFTWFISHDGSGHPPLSDILSSLFNVVLFQKLQLINDIDAYRVYGVLLASFCVGLMYYWLAERYGKISGIAASLALATYPLFWSESHFNNEKDIPETVYWSFLLFSIWKGITQKSWKWLLIAGGLFGLALGTKFNVLFIPLIVIPWLVVYLVNDKFKKWPKLLSGGILAVIIGVLIFIGSWPYLWADPLARIINVLSFYKTIGLNQNVDLRFVGPLGTNLYPLIWILTTTPVVTLILCLLGTVFSVQRFFKYNDNLPLLIIFWLIVPVARVVWPGTTVYGGIRQIMEYIPAMALLAGMGASQIAIWVRKFLGKKIIFMLLLVSFIPVVLTLIQIHPDENAYFNFLIGGLGGAKQYKFPSWGNTFGAAYRQGIDWINKNAEEGAKLVFVNELMPNVPTLWVRPDIIFHNTQRSGFVRAGEYAITLTYEGISTRSYFDSYLENFMEPVYQALVDGVAVMKVWKNDENHAYEKYKTQKLVNNIKWKVLGGLIEADLGQEKKLSYLDLSINSNINCKKLDSGIVFVSTDHKSWRQMKDTLPTGQISIYKVQPSEDRLLFSFLADPARYIRINFIPKDACLSNVVSGKIYELPI